MTDKIAELVWNLCQLDPDESMWGYDRDGFADHLRRRLPPTQISIPYCMIDCGDGPFYPAVFKTPEDAQARSDYELDACGYVTPEALGTIKVLVSVDGDVVGGTDMIRLDEKDGEVY